MSTNHLLVWNACGVNGRARRSVVRKFVDQHWISVLCLQETMVANLILEEANALMAAGFALLSSLLAAAGNPGAA
jgi:exonuclease III